MRGSTVGPPPRSRYTFGVTSTTEAHRRLRDLSDRVRQTFHDDRAVLSFDDWFSQFMESPAAHLRSSSQYIRDVFDHFGTRTLELPHGRVTRFQLFDAPWADGEGHVAGQEAVQNELYRLVNNFARDGRVSRLVVLHGPNGSAKSSLLGCMQAGMERYSHTDDGAVYTYAWIFPSEKIVKGTLGFSDTGGARSSSTSSYAHLSAEQIDARLPCELRDPPIFLIPKGERARLIEELRRSGQLPPDFVVSKYVLDGDLSPRDRSIYDALLVAYDGDHTEVLRHVQVERFYFSHRYGEGLATVEPQMHVDAEARQITADRSIANLPRPLQTVPLFELSGPLVSANRGLLEFSDLLKRPPEAYKYLLATSEEATASLPQFEIGLDTVLIASTNEKYLEAFKEHPDWMSFKARMELVRVPYLMRFADEVQIYERQITPTTVSKDLAPHVVEVAAMWAVLTRLRAPDPGRYAEPIRSMVKRMSPLEKLRLYDDATIPDWVPATDARLLAAAIKDIREEHRSATSYEGRLGASAREMRTVILNAAHHPEYRCLTPLPVFDELRELVRDVTLYDFLKQESVNGFHDNAGFITVVHDWWLSRFDDEIRHAMGLVEEARYEELFSRYVRHVSHLLKNEKVLDRITGRYVDPDRDLMKEVEDVLVAEGEDRDEFRRAVIGRIGAWGLEHSGEQPRYRELFRSYIERMEEDYYRRQRRVIMKNLQNILDITYEQGQLPEDEARADAERTIERMKTEYGYSQPCTAECAAHLLKTRYSD